MTIGASRQNFGRATLYQQSILSPVARTPLSALMCPLSVSYGNSFPYQYLLPGRWQTFALHGSGSISDILVALKNRKIYSKSPI